jgi:hypothetical protein
MTLDAAGDRMNLRIRFLLGDGATAYQVSTASVSRTDLVVTCKQPVEPGRILDGVLVLPTGAARVRVEVVWARQTERTALGHLRSTMSLRFVVPPGPVYDTWYASAAAGSVQQTLPPVAPASRAPRPASPRQASPPAPGGARGPTLRGYLKLGAAGGMK